MPPGGDTAAIEEELAAVCHPRLVPAAPRGELPALVRSLLGGRPYAVVRHALPAVAREVERLVAAKRFDAVHAEHLHAFAQAEPALRAGLAVVLRAQNVESDLWRASSRLRDLLPPGAGPWLAREARRLARYEGEAVRQAAVTVALSERRRAPPGARRVRSARGGDPTPFPCRAPPGRSPTPRRPALGPPGKRRLAPQPRRHAVVPGGGLARGPRPRSRRRPPALRRRE